VLPAPELAQVQTPAEAARGLRSSGASWDAAIEFGVDVTLLIDNLRTSPQERLAQAAEHQRFADAVQQRTVPASLRARLERARLWEKIEALGGFDPAWPEALRDGR
jgi:hypothetical protein